jgi:poly(beta-D-mannuronate) lyase
MRINDLDINHSFNFINVSKNTVADSITINNSSFNNITGAILKLDKEIDDYGIYNAEYLNITNSQFSNIGGALVDYYRGGTDESTFGPHFTLTNSSLVNVGNDKRNKSKASIHLHGVQLTTIANNTFKDSPAIKLLHTVGEPRSSVTKNTFNNTPLPVVEELNSIKKNTAVIVDNTVIDGK